MDTFTVSMFIRTRRLNGLLLVFSNSTSHYLQVWLDGGKVKVQANHFEILQGHNRVNDGHFHLVSVHVGQGRLTLSHSASTWALLASQGLMIRSGDIVHVGGLEDRKASLAFRGYFKGCIQDLRLNFNHLQFYPIGTPLASYRLKTMVQVRPGCTGDNYCKVWVFSLSILKLQPSILIQYPFWQIQQVSLPSLPASCVLGVLSLVFVHSPGSVNGETN